MSDRSVSTLFEGRYGTSVNSNEVLNSLSDYDGYADDIHAVQNWDGQSELSPQQEALMRASGEEPDLRRIN